VAVVLLKSTVNGLYGTVSQKTDLYHCENLKFYKDDIITQILWNQMAKMTMFLLENIFIASKQREIFVDFVY
jgi:hypothetical protein